MTNNIDTYQVLIVLDERSAANGAMNMALDNLSEVLLDNNIRVIQADSYAEAWPIVGNNMDIDCFMITSDMELDAKSELKAIELLKFIKDRQAKVPVFLLADRAKTAQAMSEKLMALVSEFVWIFEDSPVFVAGRVEAAIKRFRDLLLPPLMKAIWQYNEDSHEYSWAAPGHQGGVGFTKSPAGKKFYDFYGENLFRTDTGIERSSIGSLLDHSGAFGVSEKFAAKVFGSDQSYSVVVGTSGSNRTVMQICLREGDIAICDRNCHKSIEQGLILTGAIPVYLIPTRNRYGIIGPIHRSEMTPATIKAKIAATGLKPKYDKPAYAVVTNCTYDGLCYNAAKVQDELALTVNRVHFDEAWYGYARFNPMYADHFAMRGEIPADYDGPTVFATQSTHKLLNALSQASYIHIRNGKDSIDFNRFNQAYMMHATTSPLYAICASNDISTAMMNESGTSLTREVIEEAVDFRQAMARLYRDFTKKGSWFFKPWNAEKVTDPATGKVYDFADAPRELLITEQKCWRMDPKDTWHGFTDLEDNWVMLDPIKVSILGPGMGDDGRLLQSGVPAALVSSYLYHEGIVPTRTTDFQIMFLFSMGITKGKWGTLINTLLAFKQFYDKNVPVAEVLPELADAFPAVYGNVGIRDLSNRMFEYLQKENPGAKLNAAFATLPKMAMTPRQAYEKIVANEVEMVPSGKLMNRISANSIIPYPPGIPMLMSGENFGGADSPQIGYLKSLEDWDHSFPGFEHVTEGTEVIDGIYHVMCVK
ncbi:arginine decarboxylase [Victivallis sp. Marseille-Q1083]|uniref:arginine decarboxylase n=1 Tax=Victivallis sp. Marseille-Q1083 TaxID=2717288 RepID=UPI00158B28D5|nr:arginine decarboxylase [Victivallis sp. Marseille-Q1083]